MKPRRFVFNPIRKRIFHALNAALLCSAAFLFVACENDIETIKAFSAAEALPVVHAFDFETTYTDSGIVRFLLRTPELKQFERDGQSFAEFPQGVVLLKYDGNQRVVSNITARYARQDIREKRWEARNEVVAVNLAGDTLKTELLFWDERSGRIYTDEFVRIVRPDQIITGTGFESDQSMQNWVILKPRGTIYVEVGSQPSTAAPESMSDQNQLLPEREFPAINLNPTR